MALIELQDVSRCFEAGVDRVVAVDRVSLALQAGDFVCLYGPSGSGKSTLLNLLAGLDLPDQGAVLVDGHPVSGASEGRRAELRLRRIGVVFQDDNLIGELSAAENVALPLLAAGAADVRARELAGQALARVGIGELGDRFPAQMSGGQRQRVGIARGLVGDRAVLIADEPTGALDSANSRELFALLRRLAVEDGAAILVATHDPIAREYATRELAILDGRVSAP